MIMDNRNNPADAARNIVGVDVMRQLSCAGIAVVWQAHQSRYDELKADYYTETILSANLEAERDEAQDYAGRLIRERDELQEEIAELHLASLARIAELETELERRCETCRSFNALTYDCSSEWAPLKCVMNNFDGWEAKDELL